LNGGIHGRRNRDADTDVQKQIEARNSYQQAEFGEREQTVFKRAECADDEEGEEEGNTEDCGLADDFPEEDMMAADWHTTDDFDTS
jgi:hypothetical protein